MWKVAILVNRPMANSIFAPEDLAFLGSFAQHNPIDGLPEVMTPEFMIEQLADADSCITCWGTPPITDDMLGRLPRLKLVAHAAGSVRALLPPSFYPSGRRVISNAPIIAEDVAQTTLALMLTTLKQLWQFNDLTAKGGWSGGEKGSFSIRRLDGLTVGLVGASLVGKETIRILKPFRCRIIVDDPYMSPLEAERLGVEKVELDTLVATSDVISLHAPANPDCRHLLNARNIPTIKDGALVINTARGLLIDEAALIPELQSGRIMACIDVTDPEPPAADHPFRTLSNVILTPHIAGGHTANGRKMLGRNVIIETFNYQCKGLLNYEVRQEMFSHMA